MGNSLFGLSLGMVVLAQSTFAFGYQRGEDLTVVYHERYEAEKDDLSLLRRLRQYDIVYVPGLFTNALRSPDRTYKRRRKPLLGSYEVTSGLANRMSTKPSPLGFFSFLKKIARVPGDYLTEKREPFLVWLRRYDISFTRVITDTEDLAETNAEIILQSIRNAEKPVFLITRSKGGVDSLRAYIKDPRLFDQKVHRWLSLQSPFRGTPTAEIFSGNLFLRGFSSILFRVLGGSAKTLDEMNRDASEHYLEQHADAIHTLIHKSSTKVLNVASYIEDDRRRWDTIFEPFFRDTQEKKTGLKNDGIVPWVTAILPDADYVVLDQTDHVATTSGGIGPNKIDRKRVIHTLLALSLDQ